MPAMPWQVHTPAGESGDSSSDEQSLQSAQSFTDEYHDQLSASDGYSSTGDVEMKEPNTRTEREGDERSNCDLLQKLYQTLRHFGIMGEENQPRKPWFSAWHTILDLIFRLMGISERIMDLIIACLHWLADVGEELTHDILPKNVDQLKYWHKTNFPNMSQFVGLFHAPVCWTRYVLDALALSREDHRAGAPRREAQEFVLHFTIDLHGPHQLDTGRHGNERVPNESGNLASRERL